MISSKLSRIQNKIKAVIYGDFGTRKSSFAIDFATMKNEKGEPMKVLYIDVETGSLGDAHLDRLEEQGVDLNNILLVETKSVVELHSLLNKVINKENFYEYNEEGEETDIIVLDADGNDFFPDAIVIDSLSAIAQDERVLAYEISKIRQKVRNSNSDKNSSEKYLSEATAGVELSDWGRIKVIGEKLISEIIRKVNTHTCLIIRDKEEKKNIGNGKNITMVSTGRRVADSWEFALFDGNTVIHLRKEIDDDGNVTRVYGVVDSKDRMGVFKPGEEIDNPRISMWSPIIEKNIGRKEGNVSKRLTIEKEIEEKIFGADETKSHIDKDTIIFTIMNKIEKSLPDVRTKVAQKLKQHGISPKDLKDGSISDEKLKLAFELLEEY